jgi:hypothetical protein
MGDYKYRVTGPRGGKYLTTTRTEAEKLTRHGGKFQALGQRKASKVKNPARDGEYSDMNPKIEFVPPGTNAVMTTQWYSTAKAAKAALHKKYGRKVDAWISDRSQRGSGGRRRNPSHDGPREVLEAYWSKMKATEEIDARGLARATGLPALMTDGWLREKHKAGEVTKDGNWYGPKKRSNPVAKLKWTRNDNGTYAAKIPGGLIYLDNSFGDGWEVWQKGTRFNTDTQVGGPYATLVKAKAGAETFLAHDARTRSYLKQQRRNPAKSKRDMKENPTSPSEVEAKYHKWLEQANDHHVRELDLFADNEFKIYGQKQAIQKNLANKIAAGKWNGYLAAVAWGHWFDSAAKEYTRQFDTGGGFGVFTKADRMAAALDAAKQFKSEYEQGEHDDLLHKKYRSKELKAHK